MAVCSVLALVGAACSGGGSDSDASPDRDEAAAPVVDEDTTSDLTEVSPDETPEAAGEADAGDTASPAAAPASDSGPAASKTRTASKAPTASKTTAGKKSSGAASPAAKPSAAGSPAPAPAPAPGEVAPVDSVPAPPKSGKANYDSDVGVTADTIKIGTINMMSATRSLGPPIAGVQENTLDAVVKYINRNGGVAGRKLQLVMCDDGGDIARGRACYEKLKGQVFAFMPSITWLTDVIHDQLMKDKVPMMSWGWFKSEYEDPWMFPCHANGEREAIALANWIGKVLVPKGVKTVGIMYLNVSEDVAAKNVFTKAVAPFGVEVVASIAQEWDSPDESQHVLQMRSADPDMIVSFSWPAPVAKFMHDADTQRYAPKFGYAGNHLTGDPGYGPIFGDYIKDKAYGITSWAYPAGGGKDPDNADADTPEQRRHAEEVRKQGMEYQGFKWRYWGGHHISQSGWVCARIMAKAAAELGADLTREGLKRVLESRLWETGFGVTMSWPAGGHDQLPYSYNREFIYKWVSHPDGGWDFKRILPDPVFDCAAGNIPEGAVTICNT